MSLQDQAKQAVSAAEQDAKNTLKTVESHARTLLYIAVAEFALVVGLVVGLATHVL